MKELTLRDCLKQERGYEGRLFIVPEDQLGILVPETREFVEDYFISEASGNNMNIVGYVVGGKVVEVKDVAIDRRFDDRVMSSGDLMEWYRMAGKAGIAGIF